MNISEITADLAATVDYLNDITERADSTDFDDAAEIQAQLLKVRRATNDAITMLEQQMLSKLEKRKVATAGGRLFKRKRKTVRRDDHEVIARAVRDWAFAEATDKTTGVTNAQLAAERAVHAVRDLYISPSTTAKSTKFDRYGIEGATSFEDRGWQLEVERLDLPDDES